MPAFPPGDVTAGLDRATADHAVAIVNNRGTVTEQFLIDATGAGLRELVRRLRRAGVGEIAIERGDGQVVDTLLDTGLTVVVISPNQVHLHAPAHHRALQTILHQPISPAEVTAA